jgi:hypothetical protein
MATTTTTTLPTGWADQAAYGNFQNALQLSQRPYAQYPGQQIAGWDQGQAGAYNAILNGAGVGLGAMQDAQGAATYAAKWGPERVAAQSYQPWMQGWQDTVAMSAGPAAQAGAAQMGRGEIQDVQAQSFPGANLQQYLNPFTSSVIDTTMQQLGRQNDILGNQTRARASAAGAFGGNRETLAQSENNRAFLDTAGRTISGLNQANFGQAQQAIATDQNRALQAAGMNQAQDWNVGSANLGNRQQSGLQNMLAQNQQSQYNAGLAQTASGQSAAARNAALTAQAAAGNEAGKFNSDLGLRAQLANQAAAQNAVNTNLSAANALSGMGLDEQKRAFQAAQAQWNMGAQRQAFDQSGFDLAQKNWQQQRDYPLEQLKVLQSGLAGAPFGNSSTSPYYSNTLAQVGQGLMGGAQLLANGGDIVSGAKDIYGGLSSGWNALKGWF